VAPALRAWAESLLAKSDPYRAELAQPGWSLRLAPREVTLVWTKRW
jgi:hypothetical protein